MSKIGTTITKKKCPRCGTEVGKITGMLAITYYCCNINCFQTFDHEMTKLAKELIQS